MCATVDADGNGLDRGMWRDTVDHNDESSLDDDDDDDDEGGE